MPSPDDVLMRWLSTRRAAESLVESLDTLGAEGQLDENGLVVRQWLQAGLDRMDSA